MKHSTELFNSDSVEELADEGPALRAEEDAAHLAAVAVVDQVAADADLEGDSSKRPPPEATRM